MLIILKNRELNDPIIYLHDIDLDNFFNEIRLKKYCSQFSYA